MTWQEPQARTGNGVPANLWWWLGAVGVLLAVLAFIIEFFTNFSDFDGDQMAPAIFRMLAFVLVTSSLALMAALQTTWSLPARIACLIAAGYFTMSGAMMMGMLRSMFAGLPGI